MAPFVFKMKPFINARWARDSYFCIGAQRKRWLRKQRPRWAMIICSRWSPTHTIWRHHKICFSFLCFYIYYLLSVPFICSLPPFDLASNIVRFFFFFLRSDSLWCLFVIHFLWAMQVYFWKELFTIFDCRTETIRQAISTLSWTRHCAAEVIYLSVNVFPLHTYIYMYIYYKYISQSTTWCSTIELCNWLVSCCRWQMQPDGRPWCRHGASSCTLWWRLHLHSFCALDYSSWELVNIYT